ncbi:uncharacterized protein LOC135482034 [Liolophura sinensis]|uniref:uncharacterized protein LOC135482034 n=1 Tax=Liolophura sinensis TaxID=3198878 RepID=UPI0031585700
MASGQVRTPNTLMTLEADDNTGSLLSTGVVERSQSSQEMVYRPSSRQSIGSRVGRLDSGLSQRTPTPTKQVFLTTVRRKDGVETEERPDSGFSQASRRLNGFYGDVQSVTSKLNKPHPEEVKQVANRGDHSGRTHTARCNADGYPLCSNKNNSGPADSDLPPTELDQNKPRDELKSHRSDQVNPDDDADDKEEEDSDDDDDEDGDEREDRNKAPSQLLMEFLGCLMEKDYKNAEKLCKMILLYEPEHPEALKFQPLIQEKLQQEEDNNSEGESDEDDDEDEHDDDDSNSEHSDSEDSSSEEDEEDQSN